MELTDEEFVDIAIRVCTIEREIKKLSGIVSGMHMKMLENERRRKFMENDLK